MGTAREPKEKATLRKVIPLFEKVGTGIRQAKMIYNDVQNYLSAALPPLSVCVLWSDCWICEAMVAFGAHEKQDHACLLSLRLILEVYSAEVGGD